MSTALDYLRRNAIAVAALGCSMLALAGGSYAAFSLPRNSVGTTQIRNRAITAAKLNPKSISGLRAWAVVSNTGKVLASSGPVKVTLFSVAGSSGANVQVRWRTGKFPRQVNRCAAIAQPANWSSYAGYGTVGVSPTSAFDEFVPLSIYLAC
jgi:hypothetical protein